MLTKDFKIFLNQTGSSLVQVMVIAGMVSVFGLAVMQTQKNVKSVQATIQTRESNDELRVAIISLLKYPTACTANLNYFSKTIADARTTPTATFFADSDNRLIDMSAAAVYLADNSTKYFGRAKITSFSMGYYDSSKDLATFRVTVNNVGAGGSSALNLGARSQNIDIAVRVYYDSAGVMTRCMAEEVPAQEAYSLGSTGLLAQVCTEELGGSFWNGDCRMPTYIEKLSKSKSGTNEIKTDNLCQNLGGNYVPDDELCTQGFMGGSKIFCASGQRTQGFDNNGNPICVIP